MGSDGQFLYHTGPHTRIYSHILKYESHFLWEMMTKIWNLYSPASKACKYCILQKFICFYIYKNYVLNFIPFSLFNLVVFCVLYCIEYSILCFMKICISIMNVHFMQVYLCVLLNNIFRNIWFKSLSQIPLLTTTDFGQDNVLRKPKGGNMQKKVKCSTLYSRQRSRGKKVVLE